MWFLAYKTPGLMAIIAFLGGCAFAYTRNPRIGSHGWWEHSS